MLRLLILPLLSILLVPDRRPDVPAPEELWQPLGPARTGEWRDVYREEGQTFEEYRLSDPVRPARPEWRLCLLPLLTRAPVRAETLESVAAFLGATYGCRTEILPSRPLPREAYDLRRRQVSVARLAPHLARALPERADLLLAVTDRDLFLDASGYSLGWGSFRHRIGVMSLYRLSDDPDHRRRRRRVLALAAHEVGHTLSLPHCTFYPCLMNGARTLNEADRRPLLPCPVCSAKLGWNLDRSIPAVYRALAGALRAAGLEAEAGTADRAAVLTSFQENS